MTFQTNRQPLLNGNNMEQGDITWMELALAQAHKALAQDEVPVGAVLIKDNEVLATGHNQPISRDDPTAHAEMVVLREAAVQIKNYRLTGTTLYVTLEPCVMCVGAILHARVSRLVFAARDPRAGAVVSALHIGDLNKLKHKIEISSGVLSDQCSKLLVDFFKARRF